MTRAHIYLGVISSVAALTSALEVDDVFSPEPRADDITVDYAFSSYPKEKDFKASRNVLPCQNRGWYTKELSPGESATFQSPNYPGTFIPGTLCKWQFENTDDAGITIKCSDFQINSMKKGKCKDKLKLDNEVFCGNSLTSYSGGRSVKVKAVFKSKNRRIFKGFSCTATAEATTYVTESATTTIGPDEGTYKCGQANRASRIISGVETEVNEYPWQVALVNYGTSISFCGGSVISSKYLLTAAHCTYRYGHLLTPQDIQFLVGAHSLTKPPSSQLRLDAVRMINHPVYVSGPKHPSSECDIAIIELKDAIDFTHSEILPICLPKSDDNAYSNLTATVTGWGSTGSNSSDVLMEVDVPTMTNTQCKEYYSNYNIYENMICAGYEQGEKDSCSMDSGGPLFFNPGSGYTQIGVVSWGLGCAEPRSPGVYTRVTKYLSWIEENTGC